ncbi:hypothetical protein [Mesorhizobium sp. M0019]
MAKKSSPVKKGEKAVAVSLSPAETRDVYASRRFLDGATQKKLGLKVRFDT